MRGESGRCIVAVTEHEDTGMCLFEDRKIETEHVVLFEQKPLMEYGQPGYQHFADTCASMGPAPDGGGWAC